MSTYLGLLSQMQKSGIILHVSTNSHPIREQHNTVISDVRHTNVTATSSRRALLMSVVNPE